MSDEPKYRDEEWLREQYVEKERSSVDMSKECGCSHQTVRRWLNKHNIETRAGGNSVPEQLKDEQWLREQYVKNKRSTYDISRECGCAGRTVCRWLDEHNIKTRSGQRFSTPKQLRDERWLREQYVEKRRTVANIAKECGCGGTCVRNWLSKHNIETRPGGHATVPERLKDERWLRVQYVEKERTLADIAKECGCSDVCVGDWLDRHNIQARDPCPGGSEHPNWEGGRVKYGPGWTASKRRQVRERDGHECVDCGTTQAEHKAEYDQKLHVHHLIKARDIDDPEERNAPENLLTLCRDCHQRWERLSEAGIRPQIDSVAAD